MHTPRIPADQQERIREWHDRACAAMRSRDALELDCVGTTSVVPRDVFAPVEPFLLANAVAAETLSKDRVLDVGTGSGINAIVGAARSADVVAVDNNPHAVECARLNARRRYHNP